MLYQVRSLYVFKYLTEYTGEEDWSVISSWRFIALFEDRCYLGPAPLCWKFIRLDGALKITWMIGAISSRNSFSKSGFSLSGPAAFPRFQILQEFQNARHWATKVFHDRGRIQWPRWECFRVYFATISQILYFHFTDAFEWQRFLDGKNRLEMKVVNTCFSAVAVTNLFPTLTAGVPSWSCFELFKSENNILLSHAELSSFSPRRPFR